MRSLICSLISSKLRYLQALLPIHPDDQKEKILKKYENDVNEALENFDEAMLMKTLNAMDEISVTKIERYPSHLIKKILPKIDAKIAYLKQAYKFILEEEVRKLL